MLDSKQVKTLGLQFGRALQITIKTASVFPPEHKSSDRPIQQSFQYLKNLMKDVGQFTFGFVDNQLMLNNILTPDTTLRALEVEFSKHGIAAVTFEAGLTLARYKKFVYVVAAPSEAVEAAGGFLAFLEQNAIDGLHFVPSKRQHKNKEGDTIIDTDSESYILSRQMSEEQVSRDFLDSIDALLESGCFDPAMRAQALSNFAAVGDAAGGCGVPVDVAKLAVVQDNEVVVPSDQVGASPGGGGQGAFAAAAGQIIGSAASDARGAVLGAANAAPGITGVGVGIGSGFVQGTGEAGAGTGSSGGPGTQVRMAAAAAAIGSAGPDTFLQLVEASVQRSLAEEKGNPQKSMASLARVLRNTGIEKILERFPPERRETLARLKPEQIAAEYIEDTALYLAGKKLEEGGSNKILVEEEVVHLLSRSLQATHMADRLAEKLAKFIQDFAVPAHVQEKIREELQWTSFSLGKKYAQLIEVKRYSRIEFRRLLELAKELQAQRDVERVVSLANHYFEFLDDPVAQIESTELSRAPELIQSLSAAHAGFAGKTAERLARVLLREDVSPFLHFQAANALAVLGQALIAHENFEHVMAIGLSLERSGARDKEAHKKCCESALTALLPPVAIERVIELYLQNRGDSAWSRNALTLLRFAAPGSIAKVIEYLVGENDARNRLALVRLAGQLGSGSIEIAAKYLNDERWYVVRNMCGVLAELSDPNLVEHIAPALRHSDPRVQQAALKALFKARSAKVASVLADALPSLTTQVLDEALDHLMYLKNSGAVAPLEEFVASRKHNLATSIKAVQALGLIPEVASLYALGRLYRIEELDSKVRRAALLAIAANRTAVATKLLEELATSWGPLAEEAKKELSKRQLK